MSEDALGKFSGKHLVVLGCGYVGSAVIAAARRKGLRVTGLTRNPVAAEHVRESGARPIVANLQDADWHDRIERADLVVNCVSSGGTGAAGYRTSYVEGMRSMLSWLDKAGPAEALVYTSSTSVYPQRGGVVDESAPTEEAEGTAGILREAEHLAAGAGEGRANRVAVLRLAGIYGPGRHYLLDQLRAGQTPFPGRGEHRLNLAYREDIVAAIALALAESRAAFDVFNIVDDVPTPKSEVVRWLATRLGVPYPGFSGIGAAGGRRADPPDRAIANGKAKRVLGWQPRYRDFRAGYDAILGA